MKRVLVTGGAGFIGSHLCERLLKEGCEVLCVDNYRTGRRYNVAHLIHQDKFEIMRHDISLPLFVEVDAIYHLASPASPIHYQYHPVRTTHTIVLGAINMLGLARRLGIPILLASTSEIYGNPLVHPQDENYWGNVNSIGPRACYDEGKRCAETLFADYKRQFGLTIRIARIFNTYGPYMRPDDGRAMSNFIVQALQNEELTLYGKGDQTRSFCYIDDLIDGLILLMERGPDTPVNLGNPQEMSIAHLAELIIHKVGGGRIIHCALPEDDPSRRCPDISRARALLNWQPKISLEEGISRLITHFREQIM